MQLLDRIGDLFAAPEQTIVNTVNCYGVMGKGLALEFKRRYPAMFRDYVARCALPTDDARKVAIGRPYIYEEAGKLIINFPTKNHWRFPSKVDYIERGLSYFVESYAHWGVTSVAFPRLGCENGGLSWEAQVRPLMERYLGDLDIPVTVVSRVPISEQSAHQPASVVAEDLPRQYGLPGLDMHLTEPRSSKRGGRKSAHSKAPSARRASRSSKQQSPDSKLAH